MSNEAVAALSANEQSAFATLYRLSAIEVWERLSYYLLMTLVVLFLTAPVQEGGLGWSTASALGLYGGLVAAMQALPVLGGAVADQWLGPVRALRFGAILMLVGHFTMIGPHAVPLLWDAVDPQFDRDGFLAARTELLFASDNVPERLIVGSLYAGLTLVALGNALFKPNISAIIGRLSFGRPASRDAAFSLFHMFVNLGALIAIVLGGWVAARFGFGPAFTLAGFGMLAALALMWVFKGELSHADRPNVLKQKAASSPAAGSGWTRPAALTLGIVTLFGMVLFQMLGTLNLYAAGRVEASLFGFEFPPVWILSMNPVVMLLIMPPLARRWREGRGPGANLSLVGKAGASFACLALAFAGLSAAEALAGTALVPAALLGGAIAMITVAELLIGPSALSAITRIVPAQHGALGAGLFYGALGLGGFLSGQIGASAEILGFGTVFTLIACSCAAIGACLLATRRSAAQVGL
ncbi:peptide MFS transporter [Blastomonas fulva]|jgi:POT family proton-dependent oligopeptide transporter|uniref:peptide MFS transporter n=1 Tax=Blastomonas fulva TaxID=1550728 RepID=UPI003D28D3C3